MLEICLATIGVCAFGAATSVAAFFIFLQGERLWDWYQANAPNAEQT
jgi:hypothetical protein